MKLELSREFNKRFQKLSPKQADRVTRTLQTFLRDKHTPVLRYHALKGRWAGYYSISAGGDLRIHVRYLNAQTALITTVGSHAQLYR